MLLQLVSLVFCSFLLADISVPLMSLCLLHVAIHLLRPPTSPKAFELCRQHETRSLICIQPRSCSMMKKASIAASSIHSLIDERSERNGASSLNGRKSFGSVGTSRLSLCLREPIISHAIVRSLISSNL
jgi:hypothetical protein